MNHNVIVYGDFTLDLKKYPRKGTNKENTDIIIIVFLMHEEFLTKCAKSLDDAIKYYNMCKEYYYTYTTPDNVTKRYNAKEIIQIHNMITNRPIRSKEEYFEFIRRYQYIDQCYISYMRCKDFYMKLFSSIKDAKDAHFERREYVYKINPPIEIYGYMNKPIIGQIYNAYELMELFTFTHYLKKHRIIKELPIPSFVERLKEIEDEKYMRNLYKNEKEEKKSNVRKKIEFLKKKEIEVEEVEEEVEEVEEVEEEVEEECEECEGMIEIPIRNVVEKSFIENTKDYVSKNRITNTSLWETNNSHIMN